MRKFRSVILTLVFMVMIVTVISPFAYALIDKERIMRLLRDRKWNELINSGVPAIELLTIALKDDDSWIRNAAAIGLGKLKDPRAIDLLIAHLKEGGDGASAVADALGEFGAPAVEPLIALLKDDDVKTRGYAVKALGKIQDPRAVEPLLTILKEIVTTSDLNDNRYLYYQASKALAAIGAPSVKPLIDILKGKEYFEIEWPVWALGEIGDYRAVDSLITLLADNDPQKREIATVALGKIGDSHAVAPLIFALKDEYSWVRSEAGKSLGMIKDPNAVEPLINALDDKYGFVRRWAAYALGEIGDPRAIAPLRARIDDEDSNVRDRALKALRNIKAKK